MTERNGRAWQWIVRVIVMAGLTAGLWLINDIKSDMREMNRCLNNDIQHIREDVGDINQRLSKIEGKLGIDD